ncbi:MAG: helix-turn-helix domain-containing protein [Clostridia bacterium]|nr:helix-turn-helix domain-containing protein [Clostridia bacterium]
MKPLIAENLKRLRAEKNLTQEEVGNLLGVSGQAVSKWECGTGMPDLPLLIAAASFFGVSLDDLVGMNELKNEERREALLEEAEIHAVNNRYEEAIPLLREVLSLFPEDWDILTRLARELRQRHTPEDLEEAIRMYERAASLESPWYQVGAAEEQICMTLRQMGKTEEAVERAKGLRLPYVEMCNLMTFVTDGEENVEWHQRRMEICVMRIAQSIDAVTEGPRYQGDERIRLLRKIPALFDLLYDDGDCPISYRTVAQVWWRIAHLEMKAGRENEAFEALGDCARLAALTDRLPRDGSAVRCTSPLFDTRSASFPDMTERGSSSGDYARAIRQMPEFDGVRADPRMIPILTLLDDTHAEVMTRKQASAHE